MLLRRLAGTAFAVVAALTVGYAGAAYYEWWLYQQLMNP